MGPAAQERAHQQDWTRIVRQFEQVLLQAMRGAPGAVVQRAGVPQATA